MYKIAPSILSADFANLGKEITDIIEAGADWIHFDVMDNHYVPNLTLGPMVCEAIKPYTKDTPIDVHLMVMPVDNLIGRFARVGADIITFHPEASLHIDRSLSLISDLGLKAGLVLNPATPINIIENVLDKLDIILLMSVNPGFGNQQFINNTLNKIIQVKNICEQYYENSGRKILIEVDGGIKINNIAKVAQAGADVFVAGSAIFETKNYKETLIKFKQELENI